MFARRAPGRLLQDAAGPPNSARSTPRDRPAAHFRRPKPPVDERVDDRTREVVARRAAFRLAGGRRSMLAPVGPHRPADGHFTLYLNKNAPVGLKFAFFDLN
jgi:hypothetical protein